jgi:hypothetical protein
MRGKADRWLGNVPRAVSDCRRIGLCGQTILCGLDSFASCIAMEKCETIVEGGMAVPVHLTKCSLKWFRKESRCTRSRRDCADVFDISLHGDIVRLSCMEAADPINKSSKRFTRYFLKQYALLRKRALLMGANDAS